MILISMSLAFAQNVDVVKESPSEINLNDVIEINIHVLNPYNTEREFLINENLPQDIEVIDPTIVFTKKNDALEVKYYEWKTTISPNSIKTITYKIRPLSLGEYSIGATEVIDSLTIENYISNPITFKVKCISNNQCNANENSLTCPEDCPTGSADGICDYKADNVCDPDCDDEPDCKKSDFNMNYIIIPFIIIIFIILLIWLLPKIFKKKEKFQVEIPKEQYNAPQTQEENPLKGMGNSQ